MDFIDVKYINLISSRLPKFKKVKPNLYNFRCPICGDSQKQKNKARGYLYRVKNNTNYKCHNCGVSMSFNNFLKDVDFETHKQYIFEKFKDGKTGKNFPAETPEDIFKKVETSKPEFKEKIVINLPSAFLESRSKNYLESRAIFRGEFYFARNFMEFVNSIKPDTFKSTNYGEERIVIPLIRNNTLIGVQGRALSSNPIKYLTIMLDDDAPKVYGLDTIDKRLPVYVVEGPFDSTFINNSVAMCGSDGEISDLERSDKVFVYDNEPRNKEIVGRIERCIERGDRVVIWPTNIREKDINDMVLSGHNVQEIVESNVYTGLQAKLKFTTWKKI
ncbi:MAG: DNA primase [Legionellales bacterium]|nr:DNA primase [Legionellales bacterium]